jgi:hypothetical protein
MRYKEDADNILQHLHKFFISYTRIFFNILTSKAARSMQTREQEKKCTNNNQNKYMNNLLVILNQIRRPLDGHTFLFCKNYFCHSVDCIESLTFQLALNCPN